MDEPDRTGCSNHNDKQFIASVRFNFGRVQGSPTLPRASNRRLIEARNRVSVFRSTRTLRSPETFLNAEPPPTHDRREERRGCLRKSC